MKVNILLVGLVFLLSANFALAQTANPDCAVTIGNLTVVLEGTRNEPGMTPESLAHLYEYLAANVIPVPFHGHGLPLVVQYVDTPEAAVAIFPGAWTETNVGMQWSVTWDGCTISSGMDGGNYQGAIVLDTGSKSVAWTVGFMAHEMSHSLGADHGPASPANVTMEDMTLSNEQDAYYWGFLVRYGLLGCNRVEKELGPGHLTRCQDIRGVLGL